MTTSMVYRPIHHHQLGIALAAGAKLGELLAKKQTIRLRTLEAELGREAADERLAADLAQALLELAKAHDEAWWACTDPLSVGRLYANALMWQQHSPEARAAETSIRENIQLLHGIDLDGAAAATPPQFVQDQFERYQIEWLSAGLAASTLGSRAQ